MSRRGRKTRFTREAGDVIVSKLRAGAFRRHAARAAGVSEDSLARWLELGRAGDKRYVEFAREADRAMAEDAIRNQTVITAAALRRIDGDWKAAAWNLERKYPKLYGRNAAAAFGVSIGSVMDDDERDDAGTRTQVHFYLPNNGRRPDEQPDNIDDDDLD